MDGFPSPCEDTTWYARSVCPWAPPEIWWVRPYSTNECTTDVFFAARSRNPSRSTKRRCLWPDCRARDPSRQRALPQVCFLRPRRPRSEHVLYPRRWIPRSATPPSWSILHRGVTCFLWAYGDEVDPNHRRRDYSRVKDVRLCRYSEVVDADGHGCDCRADLWGVIWYGQ